MAKAWNIRWFFFRSKKAKVPTSVILYAMLGGFLGAIIGVPVPILGNIVGFFVGMFIGGLAKAYWNTKDWKKAIILAKEVILSQTLAIAFKALIGAIMIIYIFFKV